MPKPCTEAPRAKATEIVESALRSAGKVPTLSLKPYTLHLEPYTLNPTFYTLNPKPYTLIP